MSLIAEQSRLAKLVSYRSAESNTTPLSLAQEMVSRIPDEVIKNRDSKYLDPCAGTGTFLVALLVSSIPSPELRLVELNLTPLTCMILALLVCFVLLLNSYII